MRRTTLEVAVTSRLPSAVIVWAAHDHKAFLLQIDSGVWFLSSVGEYTLQVANSFIAGMLEPIALKASRIFPQRGDCRADRPVTGTLLPQIPTFLTQKY